MGRLRADALCLHLQAAVRQAVLRDRLPREPALRDLRVRPGGAPGGRSSGGPPRRRRRTARHEPRVAQPGARLAGPHGDGCGLRGDRGARGRGPACPGPLLRRPPQRGAAGAARPALLALPRDRGTRAHRPPPATTAEPGGRRASARTPSGRHRPSELFDAIHAHEEAALIGVCHTFGVLCRWSGAAAGRSSGAPRRARARAFSRTCSTRLGRRAPVVPTLRGAQLGERGSAAGRREQAVRPHPAGRGIPGRGAEPIGWETLGVGAARGAMR